MAFMGRGGGPSISSNNSGNAGGGINHIPYWMPRIYYFVPLNNTYVIMQTLVTFIILIIGIITFLATYKSTIVDLIAETKSTFINIHLLMIVLLLVSTLIVNYISRNANLLIKNLLILTMVSISLMMIFTGIKLNLDNTYNKSTFEEIYNEQFGNLQSNDKNRITMSITGGISLKDEKEYYVDECMKLYNIFKTKTYGTLGIHFLLNILLIYQVSKIIKIQHKREQVMKDDLILFDEEQNIKM